MHDLRNDPNVTFVTHCDSHGVMQEVDVRTPLALDPADLRTVPMVDLRRPDLRTLGDKYNELLHEHVRLVDVVQAVLLRLEELEHQLPALEYVAQRVDRLERTR